MAVRLLGNCLDRLALLGKCILLSFNLLNCTTATGKQAGSLKENRFIVGAITSDEL